MKNASQRISQISYIGACVVAMALVASSHAAQRPRVEARLVSDVESVSPGSQFRVGVLFDIADGWHIYDKNPGDSGLPTTAKFSVPKGFKVDRIQYPEAREFRAAGDIVTRGFESNALLWTTVTAPAFIPAGKTVVVKADADWLSCKEVCVPGSQNVSLTLPVEISKAAFSPEARLFADSHGHDHAAAATGADCCGTCGGEAAKAAPADCRGKCDDASATKAACEPDCAKGAAKTCPAGAAKKPCGPDCAKCAVGTCAAGAAKACPYEKINFSLTDANGKYHKLTDYMGKTVVLEWTNPTCPFVKAQYNTGKMQKLAARYAKKGVVWLAVDSSNFAKAGSTKAWAKDHKVRHPVLIDADGKVGKQFGAKTTPHVFVISPKGEVVYKGAVDDNPLNKKDKTKSLVGQAIDAVLAGKAVPVAETKSYGCGVKYKDTGGAKAPRRRPAV